MDTIFDEEELKLELGAVEIIPGSSSIYTPAGSDDEDEVNYDPLEIEDSEDEDAMDIDELESLDPEGEAYESSKDDSEGGLEEELSEGDTTSYVPDEPWTVKHPISQTGFGTKVSKKLKAALEILKEQLNMYKQQKPYMDAIKCATDPGKMEEDVSSWKASNPETCEKLKEQLTVEFLAYTFIKFMLRRQYDDDDHGTEKPYRPTTEEEWSFVSDFLCSVSKGENEIYNFYDRLKKHESFSQYFPYVESLSSGQVSALIWDSSVRAQRIILKLSNMHESALSTLDKIIKLNRDSVAITKTECEHLEARIKVEAEKAIQNYGTSELTTSGRRNLLRALSAPYIKSEDGIAAPSWSPFELPFTFQQLQQANFSQTELEAFQVAVLKAVIETKTAQIEDRCSQLLTNAVNNSAKPEQRACKTSTLSISPPGGKKMFHVDVKISCSPEVLIKWKNDMVSTVAKLSLEDIANDPHVNINWLSVSGKMSLHTSKNCTAEDCQRLWETVVLPNLKHQKEKMGLKNIQKLMRLVEIWGERNWDAVASGMGSGYTPFQCFSAYEYFSPGEIGVTRREEIRQMETHFAVSKFNKIIKLGNEYLPDISKEKFTNLACQVTGVLVDAPNIPLQTMAEHYNRFSNPDIQKRSFKLVEDLLLLVCMVKLREYLVLDKSFSPLRHYLPWRFVSNWACRADVIFGRKTAVWSREEDLKLLQYAHHKKKFDWKLFSLTLGPDKNRKNTRGRYVRLQERLKYDSFDQIREEYEKFDRNYAMYTYFPKYVAPLENVLSSPRSEVPTYEQLSHSPDDTVLWNYLQSFDKNIIDDTLRDLKEILVHAEPFLKHPEEKQTTNSNEKSKPIDRRKFIRGDTGSTASAIHLRKVALKPKEEVENITTFQAEVYKHYEYFKAKGVKTRTERKYLPSVNELLKMAEIHSILCPPKSKVNKENPVDGVSLDDNGYPILDAISKPACLPHHRKKNLGWVKAQIVRRENLKRKFMEDTAAILELESNAPQSSSNNDLCTNSLEELSSNDISVKSEDPLKEENI